MSPLLAPEDDCRTAGPLGPLLLDKARAARADLDTACVIAHVMYETGFVASAESLGNYLTLRPGDAIPVDVDSTGWGRGGSSSGCVAASIQRRRIRPRSLRRQTCSCADGDHGRSTSFVGSLSGDGRLTFLLRALDCSGLSGRADLTKRASESEFHLIDSQWPAGAVGGGATRRWRCRRRRRRRRRRGWRRPG